jgi:large subunit ribosomal protein L3
MLNTIIGSKKKMSQTFVQGTRVPVTLVKAGPCVVTHIKKSEKDGYWAVQLGFGEKRIKKLTKPMKGHLRGAIKGKIAPRFLREVRLDKEPEFKEGDEVKVSDIFKKGDVVAVTGTSKGKGFAGVVKRWGFKGGPRTHGQSDRQRAPGSIGQGTDPGRVHKGKKMAGHMGGRRVTVKNLIIVDVDDGKSELEISGPLPGTPGGLLIITKLASGKLEELVQEAPQQRIVEGEPEEVEESEAESLGAKDTGENKGQDSSGEKEEKKEE